MRHDYLDHISSWLVREGDERRMIDVACTRSELWFGTESPIYGLTSTSS